jgi:hypothetical protein
MNTVNPLKMSSNFNNITPEKSLNELFEERKFKLLQLSLTYTNPEVWEILHQYFSRFDSVSDSNLAKRALVGLKKKDFHSFIKAVFLSVKIKEIEIEQEIQTRFLENVRENLLNDIKNCNNFEQIKLICLRKFNVRIGQYGVSLFCIIFELFFNIIIKPLNNTANFLNRPLNDIFEDLKNINYSANFFYFFVDLLFLALIYMGLITSYDKLLPFVEPIWKQLEPFFKKYPLMLPIVVIHLAASIKNFMGVGGNSNKK